ncbi:MAG: hypothetical protein U5J96_17195 [Ignavibacteriaceae bacterium]|nr:hypothetical protein [Ignavibacteriaceae bacterium]
MKKIFWPFLLAIFIQQFVLPQQGWFKQNSPHDYQLYSVDFVNELVGWAVGGIYGVILKTTNGGGTWEFQQSGTEYWLYSIDFTDLKQRYGSR